MQNVQIDINKTEGIRCVCGNETFTQIIFLRKISALLSPTGKAELIPMPAYKCERCKNIADIQQLLTDQSQKKRLFSQ